MKGLPLGIELAEFRSFPIPHSDDYKDPRALCSGDEDKDAPSTLDFNQKIGVVICQWWATPVNNTIFPGRPALEERLPVTLGTEGGGPPTFTFLRDARGMMRLETILMETNIQYWDGEVAALSAKFGAPTRTKSTVRNGLGEDLPGDQVRWKNGVTTLLVERPCAETYLMCTTYTQDELSRLHEQRSQAMNSDHAPPV
jgi:hypothetical protein